jgi:PAS domain S-box-containing protein
VELALAALGYCLLARGSWLLVLPASNTAAVWPPAGLMLAVLLLRGPRIWPGILLGAIGANFWWLAGHSGTPLGTAAGASLAAAAGTTTEGVCGLWLLRRGAGAGSGPFDSAKGVFVLALTAPLACLVGAGLGALVNGFAGITPWDRCWSVALPWWTGEVLGMLLVTPLVVLWAEAKAPRASQPRWYLEASLTVGIAAVALALWSRGGLARELRTALGCVATALMLWIALRLDRRVTVTTITASTMLVIWHALHSSGPFEGASPERALLLAQGFVAAAAITLLLFSAHAHELTTIAVALRHEIEEKGEVEQELRRDITARKNAEVKLRESEEFFRLISENVSDLIAVVDRTGRRLYNSPSYGPILGDPAALVGSDSFAEIHPEDREQVRRVFAAAVESGVGQRAEFRFLLADGSLRHIQSHSSVIKDRQGHTDRLIVVSRDITEHKRAELAIQESERKYRELVQNANSIILRWDCEGRITFLNEFGQAFFGYTEAELLGRHVVGTIVPPTESTGRDLRPLMEQITTQPEAFARNTNENMRRDGSTVWIAWTNKAVFDAQGRLSEIFSVGLDVSQRRAAEEALRQAHDELEQRVAERTAELRQANERLKELDRLKSEFLATLSHELRTPLNSILGFTGLLRQGLAGAVSAEQKKQLDMVYGSARHLLSVINDLLDLSRIEAGKVSLECQPYDFTEVVREVLESLQPLATQKGLALRSELPQPRLPMVGDRKRVYQVLLNLANNAVKFTERGEVSIRAQSEGGRLRVHVADTGIGIKPQQLGMLFEAFRQLDSSARRHYEGTGLGLHLCRKLLQLLHGEIHVHSEFGRGSTFDFQIPLVLREPAGPENRTHP